MELRAPSPCADERLFPSLSRASVADVLAGRADPGLDPAVRQLFSLARAPDGVLTRWTGLGLDARGRLGRVVRTHLLAVASECDGRFEAADFYWNEFRRLWTRVAQDTAAWTDLSPESGGHQLREAYTAEVLIESACALANAQAATDDPHCLDRAERHCALVAFLVPWSGLFSEQRVAVLSRLADFRTSRLQGVGRWNESTTPWREIVALATDSRAAADWLAYVWFERGVKPLVATGDKAAEHLQQSIDGLTRLREQRPRRNLLYELVSELLRLRAVALANWEISPRR